MVGSTDEFQNAMNPNQLVEYLDPKGNFNPERWIFEQLSLQMPLLNICNEECLEPFPLITKINSHQIVLNTIVQAN